MNQTASTFIAKSTIKSADLNHRQKINFNISKYNAVVPNGKQQFDNILAAREIAKNTKHKAIEHLDSYLEEFERNISARGAKVIWAENTQQALDAIGKICKEKNCKTLVKSKSMVSEEIHLAAKISSNCCLPCGTTALYLPILKFILRLCSRSADLTVLFAIKTSALSVISIFFIG